jgi:hypothetical protein
MSRYVIRRMCFASPVGLGSLFTGIGFESRSYHGRLSLSFCVVLSYIGRGLCDGLITHPKESYRVLIRLQNLRCEAKVLTRTVLVEPLMIMMMTTTCLINRGRSFYQHRISYLFSR